MVRFDTPQDVLRRNHKSMKHMILKNCKLPSLGFSVGLIIGFSLLYLYLLFQQAWNLKMGGVTVNGSGYGSIVPPECKSQAFIGSRIGSSRADALLLRGRVSRESFEKLRNPDSHVAQCLGYQVLVGADYPHAPGVNFTRIWLNNEGKEVVSIKVEYHQ